jgi:hypothetical protein
MGKAEEAQLMGHLVLVFLWVFEGVGVLGHQLEIPRLAHVERHVAQDVQEILKVVRQRLTVLNDDAPILSIGEIVLREVRPCDHNVVIENMSLNMMNPKDLLHWP